MRSWGVWPHCIQHSQESNTQFKFWDSRHVLALYNQKQNYKTWIQHRVSGSRSKELLDQSKTVTIKANTTLELPAMTSKAPSDLTEPIAPASLTLRLWPVAPFIVLLDWLQLAPFFEEHLTFGRFQYPWITIMSQASSHSFSSALLSGSVVRTRPWSTQSGLNSFLKPWSWRCRHVLQGS